MKIKNVFFLMLLASLYSCYKPPQKKLANKWEGTYSIIEVSTSEGVFYSEDNPYGKMEFHGDGSGTMSIRNYNYSDTTDMGLKLRFYVKPYYNESNLHLIGLQCIETAQGYEDYLNLLPCQYDEMSGFIDRTSDFSFTGLRDFSWEIDSYPECYFFEVASWRMIKE